MVKSIFHRYLLKNQLGAGNKVRLKAVDRQNSFACVKLRWGAFLCGGSSVRVATTPPIRFYLPNLLQSGLPYQSRMFE